jgi:hypothetical protein
MADNFSSNIHSSGFCNMIVAHTYTHLMLIGLTAAGAVQKMTWDRYE